jgi:hypothetical protein
MVRQYQLKHQNMFLLGRKETCGSTVGLIVIIGAHHVVAAVRSVRAGHQ